jgi:hypothetical protein
MKNYEPTKAYRCGWIDGCYGEFRSFTENRRMAERERASDRLDYYRGQRAGREARRCGNVFMRASSAARYSVLNRAWYDPPRDRGARKCNIHGRLLGSLVPTPQRERDPSGDRLSCLPTQRLREELVRVCVPDRRQQ